MIKLRHTKYKKPKDLIVWVVWWLTKRWLFSGSSMRTAIRMVSPCNCGRYSISCNSSSGNEKVQDLQLGWCTVFVDLCSSTATQTCAHRAVSTTWSFIVHWLEDIAPYGALCRSRNVVGCLFRIADRSIYVFYWLFTLIFFILTSQL